MNKTPLLSLADSSDAAPTNYAVPQNQRFLSYFLSRYANSRKSAFKTELIAATGGLGVASLFFLLQSWPWISVRLPFGVYATCSAVIGMVVYAGARHALVVQAAKHSALRNLASALLDVNRECLKLIDVDGRLLHISEHGATLMGAETPDDMAGADWLGFWKDEHEAAARSAFKKALSGSSTSFSEFCRTTTGDPKWWQSRLSPIRDHDGQVVAVLCTSLDTTKETTLLARLQAKEVLLSEMEAHVPVLFYSYSADFQYFHHVSAGSEQLFGIPPAVLLKHPNAWLDMVVQEDLEPLLAEMRRIVADSTNGQAQYRIVRLDGELRWMRSSGYPVRDENGVLTRIVGITEDITTEHERIEALDRLAYTDSLTGLPNRAALFREIQARLDVGAPFGLLFVDLDRFKVLNDTLGHVAADRLLREVGTTIRAALPDDAYLARLGGDEFAIIVGGTAEKARLEAIAQSLLHELSRSSFDGQACAFVTASVGIAVYPDHGVEQDMLLTSADVAMYAAKRSGRNGLRFAGHEATETLGKFELERDLPRALVAEQFVLHFQTIHDPRTASTHAVEALVRWHHPSRGLLLPAAFIPILEETGFIVDVGAWVLDRALFELAKWRGRGTPELSLLVNISAKQLRDSSIVNTVSAALQRHAIPPGNLEIELTETSLMENPTSALRAIVALKALGVRIAIDDFGTGYSSLKYLADFSPDTLKIDGSFTKNVAHDVASRTIIRGITRLAHELGIIVVAEGVEQQEQLDILKSAECDYVQGYLLSRPEPAEGLASRLFNCV